MRIRKRSGVPVLSICPVPISLSDPAKLIGQSPSTLSTTVQLSTISETENTAAVNYHTQPLNHHAHLHGPDLPLVMDGNGDFQSPRRCRQPVPVTKPTLHYQTQPFVSLFNLNTTHESEEMFVVGEGKGENTKKKMRMRSFEDYEDDDDDEWKEFEINQNNRSRNYLSLSSLGNGAANASSDYNKLPPPAQSSTQVVAEEKPVIVTLTPPAGRWLDGDKNMPLKKRRASFEMMDGVVEVTSTTRRRTKSTNTTRMIMMSKTNKKSSLLSNSINSNAVGEDEDDKKGGDAVDVEKKNKVNTNTHKRKIDRLGSSISNKNIGPKKTINKSKGKRSIMEGSRCSRVNGRGWRCGQSTLVGYSLCEHHLGKGRLIRSISSSSSTVDHDQHLNNHHHHRVGRTADTVCSGSKKKMIKLGGGGVVKARSLSSLLGQLNSMVQLPAAAPP